VTLRDATVAVEDGRPLRVATLDAQAGQLERATRRALLASGAEVVASLVVGDQRSFGERADLLRRVRADIVLVPLADRGGADRLTILSEPLRYGCAAQQPAPRVLLACSDDGAIARATALLAPLAIDLVPDVRSDEGRHYVIARLREMRSADALLRDEALEYLAGRVAIVRHGPALVVDVTGSSTSLVRADGEGAATALHARPLGIGRGADHVVARAGLDRVRRWIPWPVDPPTLLDRVFSRARWPDAVAVDRESIALEIALAHEAIGHAFADARAAGIADLLRSAWTIVLTGRASSLPDAGSVVLLAVDAVEPDVPAQIARDDADALVSAAAAAVASGEHVALDALIRERLQPIAAVVPVATRRRGVVRIASSAGIREERVVRGAFFALDIGGALEVSGSGVVPASISAGPLGLIVDARPRPLALPPRDSERVPAVSGWYDAVSALTSLRGGA
jgi:hypothetical protein